MSFTRHPAFQKLLSLRQNPVDLTKELAPDRLEKMLLKGCGFSLFYGTERVTEETLDALYLLAEEARVLEKMQRMQAGEVINEIRGVESEKRSVLHTAMRDLFDKRQEAPAAKAAALLAERELTKLENFLEKIKGKFSHVLQIGIGGSDLGPRALAIASEAFYKPGVQPHFISNVDPDDTISTLNKLDLSKTLVIVVSKSGTTLETETNEAFVRDRFQKAGLSPHDHFVAVTGEGSPMDDPSFYLASFYIWDFVGGRYSATSMVGAPLLSFCLGIEGFKEVLRGAHEMDLHALKSPLRSNLPLLSALLGVWNRNFLSLPTVAIIPYSQALVRFPAHLQQLDMESNGKGVDKEGRSVDFSTGPVVWGEPGTNGQHSFYQLIHQGTDPIPLELIGFKKSQYEKDFSFAGTSSQQKLLSNLFAQAIALALGQKSDNPNRSFPGNRPSRILMAEQLDLYTLGALLSYYEHKVAFQGFLWNINSFDQEGVQLGKRLATQLLSHFQETPSPFPLGDAYWKALSL
ncbi:MAG: glucose-6-phosphate isomerase [Verrucomicrobiota bacterium]|nr:glucose-6-phosphate isomerase [Verrucomicrobiota bacterium]